MIGCTDGYSVEYPPFIITTELNLLVCALYFDVPALNFFFQAFPELALPLSVNQSGMVVA